MGWERCPDKLDSIPQKHAFRGGLTIALGGLLILAGIPIADR
jgi:hypothetical protein